MGVTAETAKKKLTSMQPELPREKKQKLKFNEVPMQSRFARKERRMQAAEGRLLARLHALLQRLPAVQRRTVLEVRLAEGQRLALESWMLSQRSLQTKITERPGFSAEFGVLPAIRSVSKQSSKTLLTSTDAAHPRLRPRSPVFGGHSASPMVACADHPSSIACLGVMQASAARLGVMRNRQKTGCYYSAQLSVGILRLMSKADRDLSTVLVFRNVLLSIRQQLQRNVPKFLSGVMDAGFEEWFCEIVFHTLSQWSLDATSMGLRFKVCIRPLWVSQALCTPAYSVARHLDKGLRALRRLHCARQAVRNRSHVLRVRTLKELSAEWACLREAYVEAMVDAGRQRCKAEARLDKLQIEFLKQQDRQMQDLSRARMAAEEVQQALSMRHQRQSAIANQRAAKRAARAERELDGLLWRWSRIQSKHPVRYPRCVPGAAMQITSVTGCIPVKRRLCDM